MKQIGIALLAACLMGCTGMTAAAPLASPGERTQFDVLAQYVEIYDNSTYLAEKTDGLFTVATRDGEILSVSVKTGALPEKTRLMVIAVPRDGDAYRWISSVLDKGRLRAYALYFVKDGERVPFEGVLSLSFTAPDGMAEPLMYRVSPDGAARELPFETREGMFHLTAAYEAPYVVIADTAGPKGVPETGNAGFTGWLPVAGISLLTLIMLGKRHTIRKKKEDARWS